MSHSSSTTKNNNLINEVHKWGSHLVLNAFTQSALLIAQFQNDNFAVSFEAHRLRSVRVLHALGSACSRCDHCEMVGT